ncbi:MAG: hypothetical protein A4E53_00004 [Pelotomaculum sp. PtaB.Bin104]|nr:MAG: hypothetical protein A4E53_00004 [Pelotomaculum sp. PtaB.Bin104]
MKLYSFTCLDRFFLLYCRRVGRCSSKCPITHSISLVFELQIIVYRHSCYLCGGLHSSLFLLYYMPTFVWKMFFLPGGNIDIGALCVGQGAYLCWFIRVAVHMDIREVESGECFKTCFKIIRHTCIVFDGMIMFHLNLIFIFNFCALNHDVILLHLNRIIRQHINLIFFGFHSLKWWTGGRLL